MLRLLPLGHVPPVVHGFSGLHIERRDFGDAVEEFEHLLVFLRRQIVAGQRAPGNY